MAQILQQQQRLDQANETAQALSLLENVVETSIAQICRTRQLFPEQFFKSYRTVGGMVSRFDMETLLGLHAFPSLALPACETREAQVHSSSQNRSAEQLRDRPSQWNVMEWNRFRAEAIILIEWIRYGALQVLRDGRLARLTFGIHLSNQKTDTLLESYSVSEALIVSNT